MEKTAYQKLSDIDTKVLTVFEYHDYALFLVKHKEGKVKPEVVESLIADAPAKFGALVGEYKTVDEQMAEISRRVVKDSLADVAMVVVYQMFMSLENYNNIKKMFSAISEEELILQIFKNSLYSGGIVVRGTYNISVNGRIDLNKMSS